MATKTRGATMRRIAMITMLSLLAACSYKPVIDTAGRSGTFTEDKAREITNDIQHCEQLVDQHINSTWDSTQQAINWYFSTASLGIIPRKESAYRLAVRRCLTNRGHSVIK
jgi:hypothetical protein